MNINILENRKSLNFKSAEFILPTIFILIGLLGAFHHSLWRDEMQGWLVAWRSNTLVDLWKANAPSGHPVLWSALIYLVKNITGTPLSMQLLHWLLGSISIICFWKYSPLSIKYKSLFTFGYYPFWEYFFVCRHYVLAQLFTFVFCSTFGLRRKTYFPAAICIGLLANSHAFAWSIAFACGMTLLLDFFLNKNQRTYYLSNKYWAIDLILSILILLLLVGFAGFSLLQVSESVSTNTFVFDLRHLLRVFGRIFGGYVLIIPNSNRWIDLFLCASLAVLFLLSTLTFIKRSNSAIIFFISGISSLFLFNYFLYLGVGSRHYGYYYLILIAALWLSERKDNKLLKQPERFQLFGLNYLRKLFPFLLTLCLSVHLFAGIHRVAYDFYTPYSAGKETARYIKQNGWSRFPIFGTRDVEVTTVAGYLDKDIYYPELRTWGSYTQWNKRQQLERDKTLLYITEFLNQNPKIDKALLILSKGSAFVDLKQGKKLVFPSFTLTADQSFERSWTKPERFYLYWLERSK